MTADVKKMIMEAFGTCPWDLPVSLMKLFPSKKQNFQAWNYPPQVLDYENFQIIRQQIQKPCCIRNATVLWNNDYLSNLIFESHTILTVFIAGCRIFNCADCM